MAYTWTRLATVRLAADGTSLDTGDDSSLTDNVFTDKKYLHVEMTYSGISGGATDAILRIGRETTSSSGYYNRVSNNQATDTTADTTSWYNNVCWAGHTGVDTWHYSSFDIINASGTNKMVNGWCMRTGSTGNASSLPSMVEATGTWTGTDQINRIELTGSGGDGKYASGSTITVWGADDDAIVDEKTTITNVPVGTRYEETDTRKIFRRKDDGFTVGLGDSADMASDTGNTSVATITGQTDAPTFTTKGWSASSLQAYTETDALLIENDDWTISFWMNSTSFTSMGGSKSPRLVNGRTSGDVNTSLLIEGSAGNNPPSTHILNAQIYKDPSGAVAANGSSGMVTNNWYNVVVTWTKSSGTVTFYVDYDGASSTGTVGSSTNMLLPASGGYWLLGSTAEQFVGYVTDYAFWNKVLTSSERQALYNSGAGVAANTIAKENLRVYYDCQSEPEVQKNGAAAAAWVEKGTA
jgi:hypothetical protein